MLTPASCWTLKRSSLGIPEELAPRPGIPAVPCPRPEAHPGGFVGDLSKYISSGPKQTGPQVLAVTAPRSSSQSFRSSGSGSILSFLSAGWSFISAPALTL